MRRELAAMLFLFRSSRARLSHGSAISSMEQMMRLLESLYVIEFGDVAGQNYRNGGVVVLETNRVFGGDSGYYYVGPFSTDGQRIEATVKIIKHNPKWQDAFGTTAQSFT